MGPRHFIFLAALWSLLCGALLLGVAGSEPDYLGLEGRSGQRILGVHLCILAVVYVLIAVRFERLNSLLWLPVAAQAGYALTAAYNVMDGGSSFGDAVLPISLSLLLSIAITASWVTRSRADARARYEARQPAEFEDDSYLEDG